MPLFDNKRCKRGKKRRQNVMKNMFVVISFRKERYVRENHRHPPAEHVQRDNN